MATNNFDVLLGKLHNGEDVGIGDPINEAASEPKEYISINEKREFDLSNFPNTVIAYEGDVNSQIISFKIPKFHENHEIAKCQNKEVRWHNTTSKLEGVSELTEAGEYWQWNVPTEAFTKSGTLEFSISIYDTINDKAAFSWNTPICSLLTIGATLSTVGKNNRPAPDEILLVDRESRNIITPMGYNNLLGIQGDAGVAKIYFLVDRHFGDWDLAGDDTSVYIYGTLAGEPFMLPSAENDLPADITKEIFYDNGDLVLITWTPNDELLASGFGDVSITLNLSKEDKKWFSNPFKGLKIGEGPLKEDGPIVPIGGLEEFIQSQTGLEHSEGLNAIKQKDAAPYMKLADGTLVEGFVINNSEANKFIKNGIKTAIDGKALTSLLVDDNGCRFVCYDKDKDYIGPLVGTAVFIMDDPNDFNVSIGEEVHLEHIQYYAGEGYIPKEGDCIDVDGRCVTYLGDKWIYRCDDIRYCTINQATGLNSASLAGFGYAAGDHAVSLARRGISLGRAGLTEGGDTFVAGAYARAGGGNTAAIGTMSSADGNGTTAAGECSSTRGWKTRTTPEAYAGTADGMNTEASAKAARADGEGTKARAKASHSGGIGTIADGEGQEAIGKYNKPDTKSLFIVGAGSSNADRKNAFSVDEDGAYVYDGNKVINLKDSIVSVSYNSSNAVLSFKDTRGREVGKIDLPVESLVKDLSVEDDKIVLTLANGEKVEVSVDAIIDKITEVRKEIIPADASHIYIDNSKINFKDNAGNSTSIQLPELKWTSQNQEYYGLVKIRNSAQYGLVLSGQYLKIQCAQDLTTVNPTWADELVAHEKATDTKPIVPKWLPLAMYKNIEAEGIDVSYDPDTWKLKLKGCGGTVVKVNGELVSEFDADTKLDAKASPYAGVTSMYYCNADGSQGLVQVGSAVGQIVQRTTNGHIFLPSTAPTSDRHATSKQYVDDGLGGKLDKVSTISTKLRVYAINGDGSQGTLAVNQSADGNTIVRRNGGHIILPSDVAQYTNPTYAASVGYVDDMVGDIDAVLDAIIELQNDILGKTLDNIVEQQNDILETQENLIGGNVE